MVASAINQAPDLESTLWPHNRSDAIGGELATQSSFRRDMLWALRDSSVTAEQAVPWLWSADREIIRGAHHGKLRDYDLHGDVGRRGAPKGALREAAPAGDDLAALVTVRTEMGRAIVTELDRRRRGTLVQRRPHLWSRPMTTAPTEAKAETRRNAKDEVRALLDRLPDDVTLEDIQYHLDVVVKVLRAEERAESEGWVPHEEVKRRIASWFGR
jgi:hypothetical protein